MSVIGIVVVTVFLMFAVWEYYVLCSYTKRLQVLLAQYGTYIDIVKRVMKKQSNTSETIEKMGGYDDLMEVNEDEIEIDSSLVINRTPEYLKESTISYLKNQELTGLLSQVNLHEWHDYTGDVTTELQKGRGQRSLHRRSKRATAVKVAAPQWWRFSKNKRASMTGITFCLPIEQSKFWLSSFFGPRKKPSGRWGFHYGIDMAAHRGTPVQASAAGIVEYAGYSHGYGNTIVIVHDTVYKTRYAHLDTIVVKSGQRVAQHQKIGTVGDTGFTVKTGKDASHLHFELYEREKQINPLYLLVLNVQKMA